MSRLLFLLILCVALAVFRAVAIVLAVVLLLTLLAAFIKRPRETLAFLGTLALSALAVAQPLACIVAIGVVGVVIILTGRKRTCATARHLDTPP